ncbi:MAG: MFS transporter [Acidimicrobiales bacterium]
MNTGAGSNRRRWAAMPFIALGVAMIIVDATIVNVAVPVIIRDLHISEVGAEWLNSIYSLVFAALLIAFGHAGDRWGRRRMFLLGTAVFVVASLVSATAVNGAVLIAGRALQGVGGAMILPATLATVNVLFTGKERAVAFAIWGSTIGVFGALGPLLGVLLTTDVSWRWAFLVNVFIGAIIVVGLVWFVPETSTPSARRGVDVAGNALVTAGFAGVVFALIEGGTYGWWTQSAHFAIGGLHWPAGWPSPISFICTIGGLSLLTFVLLRRGGGGVVGWCSSTCRSSPSGPSQPVWEPSSWSRSESSGSSSSSRCSSRASSATAPCTPGWCSSPSRSAPWWPVAPRPSWRAPSALVAWLASGSSSKSSDSSGLGLSSRRP